MYMVYWVETHLTDSLAPTLVSEPCCQDFPSNEMSKALTFCEQLRTRRRAGERISFITFTSEVPDLVGEAGVAAVTDGKLPDGTDYTWRKRRR